MIVGLVVVAAAGNERTDRSTAEKTPVSPRRPQTRNRAQREATGTGRRDRGRPDPAWPDPVDSWPDASAAPGTGDTGECCGSCINR